MVRLEHLKLLSRGDTEAYAFKIGSLLGNLQKSYNHLVKKGYRVDKRIKCGLRRIHNQNAQAGPVQRKLFFHYLFL